MRRPLYLEQRIAIVRRMLNEQLVTLPRTDKAITQFAMTAMGVLGGDADAVPPEFREEGEP